MKSISERATPERSTASVITGSNIWVSVSATSASDPDWAKETMATSLTGAPTRFGLR